MIRFEERKELKTKPAKDAELGFGRILTALLTTIPEQ